MAHTAIEEKESLEQYNKFIEMYNNGGLAPTNNVLEALRRKYFLKGTKPDNRMILLISPSYLSKKDKEYFKPYSNVTPKISNWWDATDKLVEYFNDFEQKININKLSETHRSKINHILFHS